MTSINSEPQAVYNVGPINPDEVARGKTLAENSLIEDALEILRQRFERQNVLSNPEDTKNYLALKAAHYLSEVFGVVYLDTRNRVIAYEELFHGTIDGASVYPREVVRQVLKYNAAAVIFTHNHPSGIPEPSSADRKITNTLTDVLKAIDVRVLDHIITAADQTVSMAQRGLI